MPLGIITGLCEECRAKWRPMVAAEAAQVTGILYDSIDLSQIPPDAPAVAGYTSGFWPTAGQLAAKFPNAHHLTIAIAADHDADALDIEAGDATVAEAPAWVRRQQTRGVTRPCLYASASVINNVVWTIEAAGIPRSAVRLWAAHYGAGCHICGRDTCALTASTCDGTQWTSTALGPQFGSVPDR